MAAWMIGNAGSGGAYTSLPDVESVSRPISLIGGTQTTIYGNTVLDIMARKITWTLNFGILTDTEYAIVLPWYDGTKVGPLWLKDPRDTTHPKNVLVLSLTDDSPMSGWRESVVMTLQEV